jgi:hypothetical protein
MLFPFSCDMDRIVFFGYRSVADGGDFGWDHFGLPGNVKVHLMRRTIFYFGLVATRYARSNEAIGRVHSDGHIGVDLVDRLVLPFPCNQRSSCASRSGHSGGFLPVARGWASRCNMMIQQVMICSPDFTSRRTST